MTEADRPSTFVADAVDPERDAAQFFRQAYRLAQCSDLIYPQPEDDPEEVTDARKRCTAAATAVRNATTKAAERAAMGELEDATKELDDKKKTTARNAEDEARVVADRLRKTIKSWELDEDRFEFISNVSTQCFVACDDDVMIICFRGTEVTRLWDIVADLVAATDAEKDNFAGRVHVGFIAALMEAWDDEGTSPRVMGRSLPAVIREFRTSNQKVWLTGHSLGGALAVLAAARLIKRGILSPDDIGGINTFGQPRVGNGTFASQNAPKQRHFRFVNNNDIVPRVAPPYSLNFGKVRTPAFRHSGRVVYINRAHAFDADIGFVGLCLGRIGSRFGAMFRKSRTDEERIGVLDRIAPGISDHFMKGYVLAMEAKMKDIGPRG